MVLKQTLVKVNAINSINMYIDYVNASIYIHYIKLHYMYDMILYIICIIYLWLRRLKH